MTSRTSSDTSYYGRHKWITTQLNTYIYFRLRNSFETLENEDIYKYIVGLEKAARKDLKHFHFEIQTRRILFLTNGDTLIYAIASIT